MRGIQKTRVSGASMFHQNSRCLQSCITALCDFIRVSVGIHHTNDAGLDDGFAARSGSPLVITWFQSDVEMPAPCPCSCVLQGDDFGVWASASSMVAFRDDDPFGIGDDASHHRVGFHVTMSPQRDPGGVIEVSVRVFVITRHVFSIDNAGTAFLNWMEATRMSSSIIPLEYSWAEAEIVFAQFSVLERF